LNIECIIRKSLIDLYRMLSLLYFFHKISITKFQIKKDNENLFKNLNVNFLIIAEIK